MHLNHFLEKQGKAMQEDKLFIKQVSPQVVWASLVWAILVWWWVPFPPDSRLGAEEARTYCCSSLSSSSSSEGSGYLEKEQVVRMRVLSEYLEFWVRQNCSSHKQKNKKYLLVWMKPACQEFSESWDSTDNEVPSFHFQQQGCGSTASSSTDLTVSWWPPMYCPPKWSRWILSRGTLIGSHWAGYGR